MSANIKIETLTTVGSAVTFAKLDVADVFRWKTCDYTCIKVVENGYMYWHDGKGMWLTNTIADPQHENVVEFPKSATLTVEW